MGETDLEGAADCSISCSHKFLMQCRGTETTPNESGNSTKSKVSLGPVAIYFSAFLLLSVIACIAYYKVFKKTHGGEYTEQPSDDEYTELAM